MQEIHRRSQSEKSLASDDLLKMLVPDLEARIESAAFEIKQFTAANDNEAALNEKIKHLWSVDNANPFQREEYKDPVPS